jgi:hypothetical protein
LTQVDLARDLKKRKAAAQTCLLLEIMFPTWKGGISLLGTSKLLVQGKSI